MSRIADLNQRGILHKQRGELGAAVTCYQQAIQLQPGFAEAHFNLGILYRDCGDVDQAIACLERTLRLRPDVVEVRLELGWLYVRQERWQEASDTFVSVIARQPMDVAALLGLAVVSREQGRPEEAIGLYERVLRIAPRNAAALTNLGNLRKDGGDLEAARSCYQAAIVAQPELVEPHINLGNLWLETGETEAAYAEYLIAAQLAPRQAKVQISLGNALQRLQRIPEAAAAYQRALELDPNEQDAWLYLTHLLKEIGDDRQARLVCQQLACRAPRDPLAALRAAAACPLTFYSAEELAEYRAELRDLLPTLAGHDWKIEFERWTVYAPECPYHLQFLDGNLCELKAAYAAVWAKALQKFDPGISPRLPKRSRPKIGFVVTARHDRAFVKLLGGVVERLNPERWELCVLATRFGAESIRRALRRQDVEVIAFPERFDHIVAAVRGAACDLLYYWEVGTDPTNYFLPFLRLAPVQVTSWGIQVTSGIPNLDAYLSSDLVESSGAQSHYTERLVRATTLLTYQTPGREAGDGQGNRQALPGLESLLPDQHLYGCVQNLGKFHPEFDEGLAGILRSDPRGVIVTTRDPSGLAARILRERWQARLPDVADRIWFLPPLPQADYWKVLEACEVLLDPWHFGGVTTTYDALALAQPLITLPSPYHRGRYTAACLRKIGVVATIAADPTDYVRLAVTTACDREFREEIRWQMFSSSQGAFEDDAAVGEHERIFAQLLAGSR